MNKRVSHNLRCQPHDGRPGFTLMEVLLVLVILVILASLAVSTYRGVQTRALKDAAKSKVGMIAKQVDLYQVHMLTFPSNLNDLINKPSDAKAADRWSGPYLKDSSALRDPWENDIRYANPGKHNTDSYDIWSVGPDGQDGTADDIGNWEST
ncbi:MAG TPA: type II secretion system major pseudopilin GspG [Lacipirellulaceae bacterium]|nr:type II secretion system major pseudopilin GspG [Lacipirellulaceae bacterium]